MTVRDRMKILARVLEVNLSDIDRISPENQVEFLVDDIPYTVVTCTDFTREIASYLRYLKHNPDQESNLIEDPEVYELIHDSCNDYKVKQSYNHYYYDYVNCLSDDEVKDDLVNRFAFEPDDEIFDLSSETLRHLLEAALRDRVIAMYDDSYIDWYMDKEDTTLFDMIYEGITDFDHYFVAKFIIETSDLLTTLAAKDMGYDDIEYFDNKVYILKGVESYE